MNVIITVSAIALSLVSSIAMADGFRCQGDEFRVKLYNKTQPEDGTKNPAVLVVSKKSVGTIAALEGEEIEKRIGATSVLYKGQTNSDVNGHFVFVQLQVAKTPKQYGPLAGLYPARVLVNFDGQAMSGDLYCERYLKGSQQ